MGPAAARRVGIEMAADEAELRDAAFELADAIGGRRSRRLRQLADTDEILGIEGADAMNQLVADLRPMEAGGGRPDMMGHARCARREDGEVRAALALQLELRILEAGAEP